MSNNIPKRMILCCDGTWMDSDDGFEKPTLIPYVPTGTLQVPSNVTRIARALRKTSPDGKYQVIFYHSGVGTGSSAIDTITGGLLGTGISENIREVYSFITSNYEPGDEIILVGFSRGAFTARSVAGMIRDIGLLTRDGMDSFYPIFKDQENFRNESYHDIFPTNPFDNKPFGPDAARDYKRRLEQGGLTRVYDPDGTKIQVQACAVWDTVGSLGIPQIALLSKLGLPHSTKEYKFYDTNLSGNIKHAFQALALDEHRTPFSPAVWERAHIEKTTVDLRQVWFPGAHSNVGGGYPDQEIANISLAWMMDQLASIGVSFQDEYIDHIYAKTMDYYENPPKVPTTLSSLFSRRPTKEWAIDSIYEKHKPIRPFGLGEIYDSETGLYHLTGKTIRTPGLYMRADPNTGLPTDHPMTHTNERIHSCVRIRLEMEGLGLDDVGPYKCQALLKKGPWVIRQVRINAPDAIPWDATWGPGAPPAVSPPDDLRWVWEYDGPDEDAPRVRTMVEENLGPYQRKLLLLNKGRTSFKRRRKRRRKHGDNRDSMATELLTEKEPRRYRVRDDVVLEEKHERRRNSRRSPLVPMSPPILLEPDNFEYARRDGPPSRAPSRAPSRYEQEGPPIVILPSRAPSRAPSRYERDSPPRGPSRAASRAPSRESSRYNPDEIVVIEEHDPEPSRAGRYRRDRRNDVNIEDFGPIGRAPPPVIKGERYPSRLGMDGDDYGPPGGSGGRGERY